MAPPNGKATNGSKDSEKVQVLSQIVNSDLTAERNEYHFRTPFLVTAMEPLLKDPRDVPMLCLALNILQVAIPGLSIVYGVNLFYPEWPLWLRSLIGLGYLVSMLALFLERFILMLHFASHRAIFHSEVLNDLLVWILPPLFGVPCGVYKTHHVIMHHVENNHEWDTSSTEPYQRDNFFHFLQYWARFVGLIWVELPYYVMNKRPEQSKEIFGGISIYLLILTFLARFVSFTATFWAFLLPHFVVMSLMSFGNWSQHIFVNPEDKDSNYALTYNCIDSKTNQTTFNDGYHIVHHQHARLHWSEMPDFFVKNLDKHIKGNAMTFRTVHFFDVGILVMTGQLAKLADHYVHLGSEADAPTKKEVEEKLRAWLKPVPRVKKTA